MYYQLKDGHKTLDKRLDRLVQFDERSRNFPIRALVADKKPRSYTWSVPVSLDQGEEGACVGHAGAHELAGRPIKVLGVDSALAFWLYYECQKRDQWPGENYSGTSIIALADLLLERGSISSYRWSFNIDDLKLAVGYAGPAILGLNWYSGMFRPDANGFIKPTGILAGGHAILCHGVNIKGGYFKLYNSWGADWGDNGSCKISFEDLARLLGEDGEACIPIGRRKR